MSEDTALLIDRVSELLGDSGGDVERTLTDGYAGALALEAERVRLERRFAELTGALADDQASERLDELSSLQRRISRTDEELSQLRAVLAGVRKRLTAAGIAVAEPLSAAESRS
jgi:ABC-type phosphate transport system auxiliary subunit